MDAAPPAAPIKRRLTAILAADAVGYSRQMGVDEEGTLRVLAAQRAVIDRIIAAHDGRIVGTAGDSVLAEFPSSVEAVRCAVEIQEGLQTRNESLPEAERLVFRIGVNLGDVMIDGANILGDGVNVAARLEGIAEPGGICISSSVYDQIAGKLNLGFFDIGEQSLKNIARPIRVYRLDRSGTSVGARRAVPPANRRGWVAGLSVAAVAVISAVAAWQAGLLDRRPAVAPPTVPVATPQPAAPPSEETRLKLQIAEAERAKAEAELAKARAEAETAKQRASAPVLAARRDTSAAAAPGSRTEAPVTGDSPAAERSPGTAVAPVPTPAPAVATAPPPPAGPATATAAANFGIVTRTCEAFEELPAFSDVVPLRVVDGEIIFERGTPGQPGFISVRGRPSPDGRLVLAGTFISRAARFRGEFPARFEGTYSDGRYAMTGRMGKRACTAVVQLGTRP